MATSSNAAAVAPAAVLPAAPAPAPVLEKYQVVQQAVRENGKFYLKGQLIMLTAARAAQLGLDQVKPVGPPAKPVPPALPAATATSEPAPTVPLQVTADEAAALKKLADAEAAK